MLDLDIPPEESSADVLSDLASAREEARAVDDGDIGEEDTGIVVTGEETLAREAGEEEEESDEEARKRHRRRRRGRRRGRGEKVEKGERVESREEREGERLDRHRDAEEAIGDEDEDEEEGDEAGRSKNLHRDVTPWAEAIGFIVNTNMEARGRHPGDGHRGHRGGKRERR